jgi:catechol 2,3-dioxygenase-like lactoylglutathione lyase family enzyme
MSDVPQFFRLNVEVGNLDEAIPFYTKLLGIQGRKQPGSRCYFEAGPVTLQVLQVANPHTAAKALYFTVANLESIFERARELGCLSQESVHDAPGGGIVVRPWGERSFYALDPWQNPLCFVEEGTVYTGLGGADRVRRRSSCRITSRLSAVSVSRCASLRRRGRTSIAQIVPSL